MTGTQLVPTVPRNSTAVAAVAPAPAQELVIGVSEFGQLVSGWLLGYNSPHTRRAYARDLATWTRWCHELASDPLHATRVHVDAWARQLTEADQLAPATVARRLAAVSAFYRWCVLEEHLVVNPAVHVRRPEVDPDSSTTLGLTGEQARGLLAAAAEHSPRMRALVALLLVDGLRISEALTLDVTDVRDVDRGHRVVQLTRKGGRRARAALPPLVADAIDTYLEQRAAERGSVTAGPLFVTRTGQRWRPGNAARALISVAGHAGIPAAHQVTPHALRHAAITLALDAGVPLHEVQDFAGHRDPRSTRRYDRARGRLDRHASYTLAAHLS
jgi:integrase/recombinase XerD